LKQRSPNATPLGVGQWRPIAAFGQSYHNYGAALDLRIVSRPTTLGTDAKALAKLGALATACGLRWGGNFATKVDPPHFELAVPLSEAQRLWHVRHASVAVRPVGPTAAVSATLLVVVVVAGLALALMMKRG
jgi:D-alanyl-D-alanine carboxypeptidase